MRQIPKNKIVENQYTNGTGIRNNITLRFTRTQIPFIGFYNVINGNKYFSGKTYTEKSKPLEKYNLLGELSNIAVAAAGSIAVKKASAITSPEIVRYFYKDLTSSSILIKEIDKKAYDSLAGKLVKDYQVIKYNSATQTLIEVDKEMPGLREFLVT